jgi:hypothetical protein
MIPLQAALINIEDVRAAEFEIETLTKNLQSAKEETQKQSAALEEKNIVLNRLSIDNQTLKTELDLARTAVSNLSARVMELSKTAPVLLPIARKPIITKTEMKDVAGVAIPKGNAPSAAQDQNTRDMILMASLMGLNGWRGFFNLQEVKAHTAATMTEGSISHLPGYGRRFGLGFIADTVNWAAVNLNETDLPIYLNGLVKMGAMAFYFDDANQYREAKNADGTLKYPAGELERLVKRIRAVTPDMPLIASLTANAMIASYKPLFDHVEAQTFGKITELEMFLKRGFDVYCLDGRKEISVEYLQQSIEIVTRLNPKNIFWYVAGITDWKSMPFQLPLIKTLAQRWMTLPR